MDKISNEVDNTLWFVKKYHDIGRCHMVEFISSHQWNALIAPNARHQIKTHCKKNKDTPLAETHADKSGEC